jgi:hypothetical protein
MGVFWRELAPHTVSSRPEHDGFIVMRSGETCSFANAGMIADRNKLQVSPLRLA